jgi:hypothetical protein
MILSFLVHNGEPILDPRDEEKIRRFYLSMEGKRVWLTLDEHKPPRSLLQNNFYWQVLNIISAHSGDTPEELHAIFKSELLPRVYTKQNGEEYELKKSTRRLTSKEMSQYLDGVLRLAAERYELVISPEDL